MLLLSTIIENFNTWNYHNKITNETELYNRNGFAACSSYSVTKKKFVFFVTHPWAFQMECILFVQFFYFFLYSFCHSFITSWNFIPVFLLWFQKIFVQKLWCCYGCDFFPFKMDFCPLLLNKEKKHNGFKPAFYTPVWMYWDNDSSWATNWQISFVLLQEYEYGFWIFKNTLKVSFKYMYNLP